MTHRCIELRGVEVHNLKQIDLDLPHRKLTVLCGVSGSGKTSLAIDTLYAEGQRRFIESFSAYTRQFLQRLERPACERIDGLPPALAVLRSDPTRSGRATVGTVTETLDYLRLLYSRVGVTICPQCSREIRAFSPDAVAKWLAAQPPQRRVLLGFWSLRPQEVVTRNWIASLRDLGLARVVHAGAMHNLLDFAPAEEIDRLLVIVDRLKSGEQVGASRMRESGETAYSLGAGSLMLAVERVPHESAASSTIVVDSQEYALHAFSRAKMRRLWSNVFPAGA